MSTSSSDSGVSKSDLNEVLQKSMQQSINAMKNHRVDDGNDTTKLFGLFDVDSGLATAINSLYNAFGSEITRHLSPKTYQTVLANAKKVSFLSSMSDTSLHRTAAGVTLGVNMGLFLGPSILKFAKDISGQHDERVNMARRIAPVLDDIHGGHSVRALMSIHPESQGHQVGNTVIYAHRRRMNKENNTKNWNTILSAIGSNAINIAREGMNVEAFISGDHRDEVVARHSHDRAVEIRAEEQEKYDKLDASKKPRHTGETEKQYIDRKVAERLKKDDGNQGVAGWLVASGGLTAIVDSAVKSSEHRLKKNRQPYSALEMILTLEDQVQNNPGGVSRFQLPGKQGKELPIEQYVAEVFIQHQKEMADLDPNYTEIREALKDDLKQITKPIAEAITRGDLNPQFLIRLVGEGHIVKNKGRGLANEDEVKNMLEKYSSKSHSFMVEDSRQYIEQRNFTLEHVKDALHILQGDERLDFAATIPDPVLHAAGLSEKDAKLVQERRAEHAHDMFLMYETLAVADKSDEELHQGGLGSNQIKRLHKDAEMIRHDGENAIYKLKSGPTNADGVEHVLNDFAVAKIAGDKEYLGKLIATGRELYDHPASNDNTHAEKYASKTKSNASGEEHKKHASELEDSANDNYAEREHLRRQNSAHGHHSERE